MIYDFIARWGAVAPNRVALVDIDQGRRLTYRALDDRVGRLGVALLQGLGLRPGDRVAAVTGGRFEVFELYFACVRAGLLFVPLNTRLAAPRMQAILDDAAPAALVYDDEHAELAHTLRPGRELVGVALGGRRGAPGDVGYEELIARASGRPDRAIDLEDVGLVLYTSGTTGFSKGVQIPWRQVVFNAVNTALACDLTRHDSVLAMLPLFHTGGLHVLATPVFHRGGRVVLTAGFDPERTVSLLNVEGITTTIAVPTMYQALLDAGIERATLTTARALLCGGAPCPHPLIERYHASGLPLRQGYGLTEAGPNCFTMSPLEGPHRVGSVGWPAFHSEAKLVDDHGREVPAGTPGELLLRGPHLMAGYFRKPELTATAIDADGWLHTGDVLVRREDGAFYVVDRKKEMFISGGENVYPAAVEMVLADHPDLAMVAVVALDDARWGQVGVAAVVPKAGATPPTPDALKAWAKARLASYEVPKGWRVLDALPLNSSGKIDKAAVRRLVETP
ncbi:MAG: long-chain fatty acid--CoA ligase [Deltaproteobacteria bacterium]|nr:MAG: long-chain fatty acid--CoA ligase [Deltaproteobacteria bacterium]